MEWILIFGMMAVTFLPRYIPFAFVDHLKLPHWLKRALPYVPIAVLTSIVSQNTFFVEESLTLSLENSRIIAGVIAALIAYWTKSLWWTVGTGLLIFFTLQTFFS